MVKDLFPALSLDQLTTEIVYPILMVCAQAARPHHRNAAASGASKVPSFHVLAGAPAKAAYAVIGVFIFILCYLL